MRGSAPKAGALPPHTGPVYMSFGQKATWLHLPHCAAKEPTYTG